MKRIQFLRSFLPAALGTILVKQGLAMPDPVSDIREKIPRYLQAGDMIGITCPAGAMMTNELKQCRESLDRWGFRSKLGQTVDRRWQRFGGTDEERAADFQQMLDDDAVKAIIFGRGGYGAIRIMDRINWEKFQKNPKWLIGFSDITAFHCHVHSTFGVPTIHADMANGFNGLEDDAATSLRNTIRGRRIAYKTAPFAMNRQGVATGKLVGGNLSLLVAMQGSKSALKTEGKILFIEDVSEYKYTIDRMMMNLKRSGMLDHPAGVIFGAFTATKAETEDSFPMSVEEIVFEKVKEFGYPVCFHFPAGHQRQNLALKLGCNYTMDVTDNCTTLQEIQQGPQKIIELPILDSTEHHFDSTSFFSDSSRIIRL